MKHRNEPRGGSQNDEKVYRELAEEDERKPTHVAFVEPGDSGGAIKRRVPIAEAIRQQKETAKELSNYTYEKDEHALFDFISCHWGWLE